MEKEKDNHRGKKVDKEIIYKLSCEMATYEEI